MRLTITVDIDDDDLAAELRRLARLLHMAESGRVQAAESGHARPDDLSSVVRGPSSVVELPLPVPPSATPGDPAPPPCPEVRDSEQRTKDDGPRTKGQDPDAPRTGRELLGWADRHGRKPEAVRVARTLKFGTRLVALSDDQARQVYAEMRQGKPAKGSQAWGAGRVAGPGHVGAK